MGGRARAEGDKGTSFLLWGPRCVLSQMFFSIQAMLISPACRWAEISVNVDTSGRHCSGGHSDGTYWCHSLHGHRHCPPGPIEPECLLVTLSFRFAFFPGCTHSIWKFPGQGSNPSHRCSNTGSLTSVPQREFPSFAFFIVQHGLLKEKTCLSYLLVVSFFPCNMKN